MLSSIVASQAELHARYGGVVPEVASRRHLELIGPVIREALDEAGVDLTGITRIGVTSRPGPDRSAARRRLGGKGDRLVARHPARPGRPSPGARRVALPGAGACRAAVRLPARERRATRSCSRSGERGSFERLGTTLDDAAGEAFDKGARLLGLPYPGGAEIDALARRRRPRGIPRSRWRGSRASTSPSPASRRHSSTPSATSVRRGLAERRADLAASYQRAIVLALTQRLRQAAESRGIEQLAVVGGVAANAELRAALPDAALAPLSLCTDNAAMIASAARFGDPLPAREALVLDAYASAA